MKKFRFFGCSFFSSVLILFSANALSQGPWNFQNSNEGWVGKNSTFTTGAEYSTWTLNGASRWNRIRIATDIDTSTTGQYLAVTLKNETGNTHFAVGANVTGNDASYGFLSPKPEIDPNQTEFSTVYIDMDSHPRWNGTNIITSLYLRLRNHATNNGTSSWETGSVQIKKIEFLSALPANPTMTITSTTSGVSDGSTTGDSTINLTFTSSEATTDFDESDITESGGSISNFAGSGTSYSATFTPSGEGATTIDVAANVYTGSTTGLGNTAADQFNWTYSVVDITAPTLSTGTAISTPDNDSTPSFIFESDEVGTITSSLTFSSTTTAVSGNNTITFSTLSDGVYYGETVTVTDSSGNAGSLTIPTFFIDTTAPTISNAAISSDNATSTLAKASDAVTLTFSVNKSLERTPTVVFSSGGDAATNADSISNDGGNYTITVPSDKSGNVGGTLANSFVDRGLTFVRPPVNSEAPQATWGTATGQDTARVGTNLYFRKFTWSNASSWCESINGRLATDAEVTKHLIPLLGSSSNGYWEAELKWPQRSSHYWTASVSGDNTTDPATRHKAFITKNTDTGVDVYELQGRLDTNNLWPLCVVSFERNFTSTYSVDPDDTDGVVTYTVDVIGALGNNATQVSSGSGSVTVDKTAPTMTIASSTVSSGTTSNDASIALTFTSNEATTNFAESDITVSGGSISDFSASSSTVYTATFAASSDGATSIDVAAGTFTDATGNSNTAATQFTWTMDATPPTMVVTSSTVSSGDTSNDSTIALTFTSSEATTNFVEADITVSGGSLSDFSATSTTVYTATFTPSSDGATTVDVGAGSFTDTYGNNNSAASQFSWTYDGTGPTMAVTSTTVSDGATSNDSSIALMFTSSEATTNFAESDITVSGGSLSNFASTSSTVYTATLTPTIDGATTVDIGAGAFSDAYGNSNSAASQFNWTYDSTAPSLAAVTAVATPTNDTTPSFVFSSSETGTITTSISEGFSTSTSASAGNNTITFNALSDGTYSGKTVTVTDSSGNAASVTMADFVIDATSPTMTISSSTVSDGDTTNDSSIDLTFTSSETTSNFVESDISVSGGTLSNFVSPSSSVSLGSASYVDNVDRAHDLTMVGDYIYMGDGPSGLAVIDVSDPTNPGSPTYYDPDSTGSIGKTAIVNSQYAVISSWRTGLTSWDISNPATPVYKSRRTTSDGSRLGYVVVSGDYAYGPVRNSGLAIFDISNLPTIGSPTYRSLTGTARGVAVAGDYAFVAAQDSGLAIIDVSNPASPGAASYVETSGQAWSVVISGNYAYVADRTAGLAIIDITDPTNPGTPNYQDIEGGFARGISISDDTVYLTDYTGDRIAAIDVSDPTNPGDPVYSSLADDSSPVGVIKSGSYVYAVADRSGLAIIPVESGSSGSGYTATFTPSAAGATTIDVGAGVFTDAVGNGNTVASQFNWTYDNSSAELDNVTLVSNNSSSTLAKVDDIATLSFTANEPINAPTVSFASGGEAIAANRVTVSNTSGNTWSASFTFVYGDTEGAVTYSVAYSDIIGNSAVPVTSGSGSITFDKTRPVSSISNAQVGNGGATNVGSIAFTFGLSDSTTEFSASDVSVSGGTLSNFSGSGTDYSAIFNSNGDGAKAIQIVRAAYTDAAGNVSWATGEFSFTYDGTFPTIDVSNMYSKIIDGMTDLGTATADEDVTWSISGTGVSISSSGTVTLDSPADHLIAESHTFTISASDSVGNNRHVTMTVEVGDVTAPTIDYSNLVHTIDEGDTALGYVTSTETVTWSIEGTGVSISSSGVVTLDSPASYADASYHSYRVTATDEEGIFRKGFLFTVFVNDTTAPVITLIGSATVDNELGYEYTDEGATAVDNKDGTVTSEITTVNSVDVDYEGTYTVTYDVTDAAGNAATQVVRTVTVTPDATVPVITLTGDSSVTVEAATNYSDAGASATDNIDGDVSSSITTVNNVDINVPGTYSVTYNVSDAAGNAATEVVRTVDVVDTTAPVITLSGDSEGTTAETPYSTNDPVGNGPDGKLNTADDVVIKDLFAVEGLTFVRPPLGGEAAAGTWGTAAGRDLNRVGTNRYFRKFTWEKARDWCVSINARLATGAEITSHIIPVVGPSSDGTWESELNWPQQASHYWTGSVAGDDDGSESRHKAFITYNTNNGNSVHQVQGRANTTKLWPLCVVETETASEGSALITHEQGTTYTDAGATALDSVDGVVEVETTGSVDDATAGTYVLTYTATDNAGNSATKDRTVTVTDTVSPVITLIGDAALSFEVAPSGTVYKDAGATATDGADGDLTSSIIVTGSVDLTTVGTYTLTYSLTDSAGNEATTVTRTITVTADVTVPTITLLGDAAQSYEMGTAYSDAGATAVDNIDGDITSQIVFTITNSLGAILSSVDILTPDTYTLTYSVEDATGNAAVSAVRIVEITPDVTIPVITLLGESSITLERYTAYVDSGATAIDNIDGDITSSIVTVNTVDSTKVGTYVITYNVSDGYGNAAVEISRTVTIIPIAISLSAPSDITVNATGHLTYVDIGSASVSAGEGEVIVSPSQMGPFESGMYEITWTAEDSVGTTAIAMQKVKVIPMVNLGPAMTTTEGNTLQIPVSLSGHLADSSMSVNYSITGTAVETEDYVSAGTAVMIEGSDMAAMINIDIVADAVAESDETLTITLIPESLTGAGPGSTMEQTITISEQDLPPKVSMHASQASVMPITTVAKDSGMVDVVASASDPNIGSSFTYTWGGAYNTLPGVIDNGNTLSFDPSTMDSGVISVSVEVSDGVNTTMASILLNVVTSMPTLSADSDSDSDGVDDLTEGLGDDDMDGVPNYLDSIISSNVIPTASSVAQSEAGTSLSLGAIALGNGDHDVSVSEADVAAIDTADVGFDYIELSDFVISGAEPGHSYKVTIPLSVSSSSTATYRKYVNENMGWQMFVEDASNMIMSADSSNGVCPAAGSDEYGPGWYIGDDCLQLMIEDGGPNDADGLANGVVIDPSGVAEKFIGTPSTNSSAVLGANDLNANGSDSTSITVTAVDDSGMPLEHLSVSGSIDLSGSTVSGFVEQGEGVYTATVTAGTASGTGPVKIDISNGQVSVTIYSDSLTLNNVSTTPVESSGGGGCAVSTNTSGDNTLVMMLLAAVLLLIRRRYYQNQ